MALSFGLLWLAMKSLPVGTAYAIHLLDLKDPLPSASHWWPEAYR